MDLQAIPDAPRVIVTGSLANQKMVDRKTRPYDPILADIALARGMPQIAKDSDITREALYKALRPGSEPRFETISHVCAALGVRLVACTADTSDALTEFSGAAYNPIIGENPQIAAGNTTARSTPSTDAEGLR